MTFLKEWKKLLICIALFLMLFALQHFTGFDFSGTIKALLDFAMTLLGVNAVRYSILSSSEREAINKNIKAEPPEDYPEQYDDIKFS